MQGLVRRWGNSASIRIPTSILQAAHLHLDQPVDIREEDGRIVIEPIAAPRFTLDALVAGITDENRHAEIDTGPPVGREIW